jgi:dienelactone hydrolase
MKRFQEKWNTSGVEPAAYIPLYPSCITTFIGDTDVAARPIRIFHGIADDYVEIAPCRAYVARLRTARKDVTLTEFADTWHAFDYPLLPTTPTILPNGQITHCVLKEEPIGIIVNTATMKPFSYADSCVTRDAHVAYSASATRATEAAVKELLRAAFKLN